MGERQMRCACVKPPGGLCVNVAEGGAAQRASAEAVQPERAEMASGGGGGAGRISDSL